MLYTGNDDNIINDLITPYRFYVNEQVFERRFVGVLQSIMPFVHWRRSVPPAVKRSNYLACRHGCPCNPWSKENWLPVVAPGYDTCLRSWYAYFHAAWSCLHLGKPVTYVLRWHAADFPVDYRNSISESSTEDTGESAERSKGGSGYWSVCCPRRSRVRKGRTKALRDEISIRVKGKGGMVLTSQAHWSRFGSLNHRRLTTTDNLVARTTL